MTNEEIMKLLKEHEERKASGKPFTDAEYAEADASNWRDLNARIETDFESKFAVIA